MLAGHVGLVDAGVGGDEAVAGLGDQDAAIHFDDAARFTQDQLDQARILLELRGPGAGQLRRLERAQIDDGPFRLGHDLLRDHDDGVAVDGSASAAEEGGEVVARAHFGKADDAYDPDGHRKRAMRLPGARSSNSATSWGVSMSNIRPPG